MQEEEKEEEKEEEEEEEVEKVEETSLSALHPSLRSRSARTWRWTTVREFLFFIFISFPVALDNGAAIPHGNGFSGKHNLYVVT
jgi:hypothetical protein